MKKGVVVMTVKIRMEEDRFALQVDGDIYEEQAECLKNIFLHQAGYGAKKMEIRFCDTYYMNCKGKECLKEMQKELEGKGIEVSMQVICGVCRRTLNLS